MAIAAGPFQWLRGGPARRIVALLRIVALVIAFYDAYNKK